MNIQPKEYLTIEYYPDSVAVYFREYYYHCEEIRNHCCFLLFVGDRTCTRSHQQCFSGLFHYYSIYDILLPVGFRKVPIVQKFY